MIVELKKAKPVYSIGEFVGRCFQATFLPETFFEQVRDEKGWGKPLLHLLGLEVWIAVWSVLAWGLGNAGNTPINSSLGSQMDIYPYWRDVLLPQYGFGAYPLAAVLIMVEMSIITLIWTPLVFFIFRFLGGSAESNGILDAFKGFVYGLSPCAFGGFLPYLGLATGFYASLLQFFRGPAITLRNRSAIPYLFFTAFMTYAIARYWFGSLL